jgi:CRISPR/Cas system-associated protein Cas7 (RAMP superfamily)
MPKRSSLPHSRRNPVAQAVIMRKGGVHQTSRSAKRQKDKRKLRKQVTEAIRQMTDSSITAMDRAVFPKMLFCC